MQIIKGIKKSLQDVEALVNIYQKEIIINHPLNLINVSDTNIKGYYDSYIVDIYGNNLVVSELTNITKISGKIIKVIYESK